MIIDGRALAQEVLLRTKGCAAHLGRVPRIAVIVANESPATTSYLAIKEKRATDAGCVLELLQFPEDVSTAALCAAVESSDADAIIVQLPLPAGVNAREVCDAIPFAKDADVLSTAARAAFESTDLVRPHVLPPVVGAVQEIFKKYAVDPKGKQVVVVGAGFLVGAPVATWLTQQGAEVTTVTRESGDLALLLGAADITVSGAGAPHLIVPDMLKEGVVLIDAGTSESGGAIVGDADPLCADKCSIFTPVPGGVGPLAVAKLFENTVTLAENATNQ